MAGFIKVYTIERISLLGAFGNKAGLFLNVIACIADDYTVRVLKKLRLNTTATDTPQSGDVTALPAALSGVLPLCGVILELNWGYISSLPDKPSFI